MILLIKNVEDITDASLINEPPLGSYDGVIMCVAHHYFVNLGIQKIRGYCKQKHVLYDLKHIFPKDDVDLRL